MRIPSKCIIFGTAALMLSLTVNPPSAAADEYIAPSPFSQLVQGLNPMNWRMPKLPNFRELLPGSEEKARIKKKKDGLVDEVGKTASSSWQRTKQAFSPARFMPASARTPSQGTQQQPQQPGFFRSLFLPPAPPENSKTVTEFLSRPSPGQ